MTVLREATHARHRAVEKLLVIQALLQGHITDPQYLRYLQELSVIYHCLEDRAQGLGLLDRLSGIQRWHLIQEDIRELGGQADHEPMAATQEYLDYVRELSQDPKRSHLLMAHVYVRHMGDLYGGKILARQVPGTGRAYQFQDRPGLIREFNNILTVELGEEANRAFDWFIRIFESLGHEPEFRDISTSPRTKSAS